MFWSLLDMSKNKRLFQAVSIIIVDFGETVKGLETQSIPYTYLQYGIASKKLNSTKK